MGNKLEMMENPCKGCPSEIYCHLNDGNCQELEDYRRYLDWKKVREEK